MSQKNAEKVLFAILKIEFSLTVRMAMRRRSVIAAAPTHLLLDATQKREFINI